MFSSRDPIYDDTEIAQFFGWKPHTVVDRRQQYDLRGFDELKEKIQGKNKVKLETFDIVKQERDNYEKMSKELLDLKKENKYYKDEIENLSKQQSELKETIEASVLQLLSDKGYKIVPLGKHESVKPGIPRLNIKMSKQDADKPGMQNVTAKQLLSRPDKKE